MPRLTPVNRKNLVKRFRELGFEGPYAGGKHPQMLRDDVTVIIPNPHEGDISVGLLSRLLRQAGVSREEWLGQDEGETE
ncbi:MAG: type II toxin-antitoxin system HicA family toxin [Myxacorys californica WJT36-NPBG1]|jgi:predicted RNA binding protein YcfA (HicA-like mRNA interferase family)|nr:type II toxin-antitoxin system HicA family toxin [Myxacorys californica WJT36-NPBG1]